MPQFTDRQKWEFIARAIVSIVVLVASIIIIFSGDTYSDATTKWAFGSAGIVVGYWLR
jgi:hypothetical protein